MSQFIVIGTFLTTVHICITSFYGPDDSLALRTRMILDAVYQVRVKIAAIQLQFNQWSRTNWSLQTMQTSAMAPCKLYNNKVSDKRILAMTQMHLSVGGNTWRLWASSTCRSREMGTTGADCSWDAMAMTPGPLPQSHLEWGWGWNHQDSHIFRVGGQGMCPGSLWCGVLGLFSSIFFSTSLNKKVSYESDINQSDCRRVGPYQLPFINL